MNHEENRTRGAPASVEGKPARAGAQDLLLDTIIPYQTNRLTFRMNRLLNRDLRAHGINIAVWRVMAVLDYNDHATVNDLAEYAMIEQSTLSRLLARMEADGFLKKTVGARDGRVRSISLTSAGREKYDEVRALTLAHVARIMDGIGRAERQQFRRLLERMQRNLENPDQADGPAT